MFDDLSLVQKCAIDHLNNAIHFAKKLENTRIRPQDEQPTQKPQEANKTRVFVPTR